MYSHNIYLFRTVVRRLGKKPGYFLKNKVLTHDSSFKSALKYSWSNIGNQQGDLQRKNVKKTYFMWFFFMFGLGFLVPTLVVRILASRL